MADAQTRKCRQPGSSRAGHRDLRGNLVEVIGCTLSMSGCREDGAVVVLEDFEPSREICGVFFPWLLVQFGGAECGAEFSPRTKITRC